MVEVKVKKPFKVMESDGHNSPTVHVFRDKDHFMSWMENQFGGSEEWDQMKEDLEDGSSCQDPNMNSWEEYSGLYEVDHTKEV